MMMLPFLVVGALVLVYILRWFPVDWRRDIPVSKRKRQTGDDSSALEILEERYARGEISREEYLEMREDLQG